MRERDGEKWESTAVFPLFQFLLTNAILDLVSGKEDSSGSVATFQKILPEIFHQSSSIFPRSLEEDLADR